MKIPCNVICDLLPSYIDEICSDDTKKLVEEHIAGCETCRRTCSDMKNTQVDMTGNEAMQIDHLKKIRSRYNTLSLGSYLLLFMMLLPVVYFLCRDTEPFSDMLFIIVLPVLILASFLTAGSDRTFTKMKCCLCGIACLLIVCEIVLMKMAFSWTIAEVLPFGMETENIGPFIRMVLLVFMTGELAVLIYGIVNGRLKNTDNTYCAAISATGVILSLSYVNLLRQLEAVDRLLAAFKQITVVLAAELVVLMICYAVTGWFLNYRRYRKK